MNVKLLDRATELGWRRLEEEEEGEEGEEGEQCTGKNVVDSMRTGLPLSGAGFARKLHQIWYVTRAHTHTLLEYCIVAYRLCGLVWSIHIAAYLYESSSILFTAKTGKSRCGWLPCSVTKATTQVMQLP